MALRDTILARVVTFLRIELEEDVSDLSGETTLGTDLGFTSAFVDDDFRPRIVDWFEDLEVHVGAGTWDEATDLATVAASILGESSITTAAAYRSHMRLLTGATWDTEVGADSVPVSGRAAARGALNRALRRVLLRDIALADLAGDKSAIVPRLLVRMIV